MATMSRCPGAGAPRVEPFIQYKMVQRTPVFFANITANSQEEYEKRAEVLLKEFAVWSMPAPAPAARVAACQPA